MKSKTNAIIFFLVFLLIMFGLTLTHMISHSAGQVENHHRSGNQIRSVNSGRNAPVRIATFNIQNFGQEKVNDPYVMSHLTRIVRNYDIMAVQELSDCHLHIGQEFLMAINRGVPSNRQYDFSISPRTGLQEDDHNKQEQYAVYFNSSKFVVLDQDLYDDSEHDYFGREPWTVLLKHRHTNQKIVIVTVHTVPRNTIQEIDALHEVSEWARQRYHTDNIVILGDMNADCSYISARRLNETSLRQVPSYLWIVPDDADTNVADTACAYDRIVIRNELESMYTSNWGVDQRFTDDRISDHWPVWFEVNFVR